jgi:hypothetical protein
VCFMDELFFAVALEAAQQEHHKKPNLWVASEVVLQNKY